MDKPQLLYAEIRTPNMLPDRSADVVFLVDKEGNPMESLTQQQFKKECDVNFIVESAQKTGFIAHTASGTPSWGDFGDATDFHSAKNYLIEAENAFMSLDAKIRARFDNDPSKLLDFLTDTSNIEEAIELGLAERTPFNGNTDPVVHSAPSKPVKQAKNAPEAPLEGTPE